jgi:PAS domain S-box-containing protein
MVILKHEGGTVSRLFEALRNAADGAFVVDGNLRIVFWNKAAEAVLGFKGEDVTSKFCYQLLRGCDERRNMICKASCPVLRLTLKSLSVPNYDIQVTTKRGDNCWLNMSVFTYSMNNTNGNKMIVHLFRHLNQRKVNQKLLDHIAQVVRQYQDIPYASGVESEPRWEALTLREREILVHLAKGYGTSEIGELLYISHNTVRNHVQRILEKLQVHTRLEAVTYAIKNDLISY